MVKIFPVAYIDPGSGYVISTAGTLLITIILGFLGGVSLFGKKIFRFFRKDKRRVFYLLSVLLIFAGVIEMVITHKKAGKFNGKIVILGFDGLSPEIIESMMKEGKLPYFSELSKQGSYRRLSTTNPPQSPVAWTGFSTGQNPGKHGIFDFIKRNPKTYGLDLSTSDIVKGKPKRVVMSRYFWEYASDLGVPSVIMSCPVTFPPSKLEGRMLSGMGVPDVLGTEGTFSFFTSEPASAGKKDIGGNVFEVKKSSFMTLQLIGPKKMLPGGGSENVKVPFAVALNQKQNSVIIELQKQKIEIKPGQWSGWLKVSFPIGLFRKVKGIMQFYLVEIVPEFKLYASPVNFDPSDLFFPISYPGKYAKELAEKIGPFYTQGMPMDTWAVNEGRLSEKPFLEQANEVLREKKAMLDLELNRFQKGILFAYFEFPDTIQHMFWRYIDPKHPLYEKDSAEYKELIKRSYQAMDEILGETMKKINEGDLLIVLSDHGFNTFRRAVHLNSWLRENGYLFLKNHKADSGTELLQDIDWSKTKAYAIGFGAIYINQKSRESYGIVNPGKETELLKKELARKLEAWKDSKYNQRIINKVYFGEEIFHGAYSDKAPDLYVGFNLGYRASWQTAIGGVLKTTIEDNKKKWSGDHLFDPKLIPGVIFANRKLPDNPSIYDLTPTILKTIGFDDTKIKAEKFDGQPLF